MYLGALLARPRNCFCFGHSHVAAQLVVNPGHGQRTRPWPTYPPQTDRSMVGSPGQVVAVVGMMNLQGFCGRAVRSCGGPARPWVAFTVLCSYGCCATARPARDLTAGFEAFGLWTRLAPRT